MRNMFSNLMLFFIHIPFSYTQWIKKNYAKKPQYFMIIKLLSFCSNWFALNFMRTLSKFQRTIQTYFISFGRNSRIESNKPKKILIFSFLTRHKGSQFRFDGLSISKSVAHTLIFGQSTVHIWNEISIDILQ